MILGLDTSTPECNMSLYEKDKLIADKKWLAERRLASEILRQLEDFLHENNSSFEKLTGLIVYRGPGSYTGLRIGITTMNTISDSLNIPIVGALGADWQLVCLERLLKGESDKIVLPEYGSPPHITKAKK